MYAIIATGGKQYKVAEGDLVQIEKLEGEPGSQVGFAEVLLVCSDQGIKVGTPYLAGAKVTGVISEQSRADKITIIKFRRRKHYMRKQGHRQYLTTVKIAKIES